MKIWYAARIKAHVYMFICALISLSYTCFCQLAAFRLGLLQHLCHKHGYQPRLPCQLVVTYWDSGQSRFWPKIKEMFSAAATGSKCFLVDLTTDLNSSVHVATIFILSNVCILFSCFFLLLVFSYVEDPVCCIEYYPDMLHFSVLTWTGHVRRHCTPCLRDASVHVTCPAFLVE